MATACFLLVTFLPLPDFSVPSFFSFITLCTLLLPLVSDFVAIRLPSLDVKTVPISHHDPTTAGKLGILAAQHFPSI